MPLSILRDVLVYFGVPALVLLAAHRWGWVRAVGAATFCYIGGMVYANVGLLTPHAAATEGVAFGTVALSVPLLLFSVDVVAWSKLARSAMIAFGLAVIVVAACTVGAGLLFRERLQYAPELAGMLSGVYIGGTPNMAALYRAFDVPTEVFVNCNASDLFCSAFFMLFVLSVGPRVLTRFFRPYPRETIANGDLAWATDQPATWLHRLAGLGLAAVCCVGGALAYGSVRADLQMATSVLVITTVAVLASLSTRVRKLPGTYSSGQYLLLVFCFAAGAMADLGRVLTTSPMYLAFTAVVLGSIIVLLFVTLALAGIDRDTAMVTAVATIMSPPFIAPIADKLANREVLFTGIASGLMGYAVGNYVGIAVTWVLHQAGG